MEVVPRQAIGQRRLHRVFDAWGEPGRCRSRNSYARILVVAALVLIAPLGLAQASPHITAVDPAAGKVNDDVTVTGESLGKGTVSAVFLSDDKTDYKATVVEQAAEKIVMKVPRVKAGSYNVSIQVGNNIYIQPVRFEVQE